MLPNLPAGQQLTQRLVNQFNEAERQWRDLQDKFNGVAKRLKPVGKKRKKRTGRRIVGFQTCHAKPDGQSMVK
jgi:hypothetical protein